MKQMIKKLLVVAILLSALPSWAYDFCVDGIYYGKNSDGKTVYVTNGSNSYSGSVVIPSTVTDSGITYSVTEIGRSAFDACSGLTSVTIPNSVTSIGNYAFYNCSRLKSVTIPNSVTSIGEYTFFGCSGLTSVIIPNSVTSIGSSAFYNCIGLTSVTIGNSVTSIGSSAFYNCSGLRKVVYNAENCKTMGSNGSIFQGCSNLTSLTIGESVKTIPSSAFYNCLGLTSVTIPNSVTSIGSSAFSGCSGLTKVEISDIAAWCNISFGDYSANPLYYAHHLYQNGKEVTNLVIPNSVTSIGDYAFSNCSGLTTVTIPNSVTSIGDYVFSECNLSEVTSLAVWPPTIMENTFSQSAYDNSTLYVYEMSEVYYRENEFWQNFYNVQTLSGGPVIEPVQLSVLFPDMGRVKIAVPRYKTVTLTVLPNDVAEFGLSSATFNGVEIIDELDENYQYTTPVLKEDAVLSVVYVNVDGGVDQSLANRIKVSASNGTVRVMGAAPESEVLVCDLSGKIVRKSTEKTFTLGEGIYVLNVEGLSFKFAM